MQYFINFHIILNVVKIYIVTIDPPASITIETVGSVIQGTSASLICTSIVNSHFVNTPIQFTGRWTRQDGSNEFEEVTTVSDSVTQQNIYSNTLLFFTLRSNSTDGGLYTFSVSLNSQNTYILSVTTNQTIIVNVEEYPQLNITTQTQKTLCGQDDGLILSASTTLLTGTDLNATVSYTWTRENNTVSTNSGQYLESSSLKLCPLTGTNLGDYNVTVCLQTIRGGIYNHCSSTTISIRFEGKIFICINEHF